MRVCIARLRNPRYDYLKISECLKRERLDALRTLAAVAKTRKLKHVENRMSYAEAMRIFFEPCGT